MLPVALRLAGAASLFCAAAFVAGAFLAAFSAGTAFLVGAFSAGAAFLAGAGFLAEAVAAGVDLADELVTRGISAVNTGKASGNNVELDTTVQAFAT